MSNGKKSPLKSTNALTDWITIILAVILGALGFFKILPDLQTSASLGAEVADLITNVTIGAWGSVLTAAIKLWNTISHLLSD